MLTMFVRGFNDKTNNIKCVINNEDEVFQVIKGYEKYTEVLKKDDLPKFRQHIFKVLNTSNTKDNVKESLTKILGFIINSEVKEQGLYWY